MRQTTQRKVLAGVLGLGLVGLVVDRVVLGPSGASASFTPDAAGSPASPATTGPRPDAGQVQTAEATILADLTPRLRQALEVEQWSDRDILRSLRRTPEWARWAAAEDQGPVTQAETPAARFRRTHQISAVLKVNDQWRAKVGQRLLSTGDTVEGFTVVRIDHRSVLFKAGAEEIELAMPNPIELARPEDR